MKVIKLLVAPDYSPEVYIDWRLLTYMLQNELNRDVVLLTPENHEEFDSLLQEHRPELVYANPFDVIELTEKYHYEAFMKPKEVSDEIILFSSIYSEIKTLEDLPKPLDMVSLSNKELTLVSQLLLEAVDFSPKDICWHYVGHLPAVMRKVGGLDIGVGAVYADYFYGLSPSRQSEYRILIESRLEVLHHVFLIHESSIDYAKAIQKIFLFLSEQPKYQRVFHNLGWHHGLAWVDDDESQFFLDILRTLNQNA
ncbi:MAG: PhnD/SsuA/transferrin family substrate-binding protein [Cardiobacteriaceae bacterium]|nr:PhnD/SsuA/transferrin family substrate-binding protein [Cardiobacteriaceae bacterium]